MCHSGDCHLTSWIKDLLYLLQGYGYVFANDYNKEKLKYVKCVITEEEKDVKKFKKLGVKNIIVRGKKDMYDVDKFNEYLGKKTCIKIKYVNDVFYKSDILFLNFLKWCCLYEKE